MSEWALRTLVAVVLVFGTPLVAQPLADRVPAGAEVYVGWKGADALQAQYAGSHLQGIMQASQLPAVFEQTWPRLIARVAQEDEDTAEALKHFGELVRVSWRYPAAFFTAGGDEQKRGMLLIQAGGDAEALVEQLRALIAEQAVAGEAIRLFARDGMAVVAIGDGADQLKLAGQGDDAPRPLSADPHFASTIAQVQKDAAIVYYVNGVISRQSTLAAVGRHQAEALGSNAELVKVVEYLIAGLDGIAFTANFEGQQWRTDLFVAAPNRERGLVSLLEAEPLPDEILKAIPSDADWVAVRRLDLNNVYLQARAATELAGPDALKTFEQVMGGATMALGTNLQQNLFEPLGDAWAVYIAPRSVGAGLYSGVLLNRVDDPARVNRALSSIAIAGTNVFSNAMQRQKMSMQLSYVSHNGTRISYLPTPLVSPAWAVKGNLLIMGFYPQSVAAALDAAAAEDSILDNDAFRAMREQLPDRPLTSISFVNLPQTAEQSYATLLMLSQTYSGAADLFGLDGPPMLLPILADLKPHLTPAGRAAWVDDAGWHVQTISPFPFSAMFGGEVSALVGQYPVLTAALIPALASARQAADDTRAVSNLRQLGVAIMVHAAENRGLPPEDLSELVRGNYITPVIFAGPGEVPVEVLTGSADVKAAWVKEHSPYVYVRPAGRLTDIRNASGVILIYEDLGARSSDRIAAVFVDGHAELLTLDRLNQLLEQQGAQPAQ